MTSKSKINGIENNKNDIDIDTEIKEYIAEIGFVRRRQLVKYLIDNNPNKRGYSTRTINRKIDQMINSGILIKLKINDLKNFGVEESDERSIYLTLKSSSEIKNHLDRVFSLLKSGEEKDKKTVLDEINLYKKRYVLNPNQLDILVSNLISEDDELINKIRMIIYHYVTEKQIEPNNKKYFVEILRKLLERYPEPDIPYKNLRTDIIYLLGYYNDRTVIDQLIKDTNTVKNLDSIEKDYSSKFTSTIIEEHREELFDFINEVRREGKEEAAKFINRMRYQALRNLGMVDDSFADKGEWSDSK